VTTSPIKATIADGSLHIDAPSGFLRTSLLHALDVPLAHIESAEVVEAPAAAVQGWREGIGLPHLRMGTWRHDGTKDYVAIRTDHPALVITLRGEEYARMIICVDDPHGMAAALAPRD
jgi:hypothetical protein